MKENLAMAPSGTILMLMQLPTATLGDFSKNLIKKWHYRLGTPGYKL